MDTSGGAPGSPAQSDPIQTDEIKPDPDPVCAVPPPEAEPMSVCTPSDKPDPTPKSKKYYKKVLYYAGGSKLPKPTQKKDEARMRCDGDDDSESECTSSDSDREPKPARGAKRVSFKREKRFDPRPIPKRARVISESESEIESVSEEEPPVKRSALNLRRNISHYQFF
jgi:hypothetical protein